MYLSLLSDPISSYTACCTMLHHILYFILWLLKRQVTTIYLYFILCLLKRQVTTFNLYFILWFFKRRVTTLYICILFSIFVRLLSGNLPALSDQIGKTPGPLTRRPSTGRWSEVLRNSPLPRPRRLASARGGSPRSGAPGHRPRRATGRRPAVGRRHARPARVKGGGRGCARFQSSQTGKYR